MTMQFTIWQNVAGAKIYLGTFVPNENKIKSD